MDRTAIEKIAEMQRKIDDYERFVHWAFLALKTNNAPEVFAFDYDICNTTAQLITNLIEKSKVQL